MIRKSVRGKGLSSVAFLTGLFLLVVAALLVLPPATTVLSQQILPGVDKKVVTGGVVAVENSSRLTTLTLRSPEIGRFPNNEVNIFLSPSTPVQICDDRGPARDLLAGRRATIMYHEERGLAVADSVAERC